MACGRQLGRAPGTGREERRLATILFADLSGYTAIAERLEPERVKTIIVYALRRLGAEATRFGGRVDKYIGDNVMAVFGAPIGHEDDPERAVRAGLAMQAAMGEINRRIVQAAGTELALRVGINTGEVLAGPLGDSYTVIGDTVNVASRLEGEARPGSILIGESTWKACRTAFECRELEPLALRGKSEPVAAFEVLVALTPDGRRATVSRTSALIGRSDELARLKLSWARAGREDRARLAMVIGAPGIGKTHLLEEFASELTLEPSRSLVRIGRCPAYGAGTPYWPFAEIVREQFGIAERGDPNLAWRKLIDGIDDLTVGTPLAVRGSWTAVRLAALLGIEPGVDVEPLTAELSGPDTQAQIFSAFRLLAEAISRTDRLVIAIDDAHWADEGSLQLIEYLVRYLHEPVLVLCLGRDELTARRRRWSNDLTRLDTLHLHPLAARDCEQLLAGLLATRDRPIDPELREQALVRSGGNPLFLGQIVERILESEGDQAIGLPATVAALIGARLDALSEPERALIEHASVLGDAFTEAALDTPALLGDVDRRETLRALEDKDLIEPRHRGADGNDAYAFKHALVRELAYNRLPKLEQARKHAAVAALLTSGAGSVHDAQIATIAHHRLHAANLGADAEMPGAELAELRVRAFAALEAAGDAAGGVYSNHASLRHYRSALTIGAPSHQDESRVAEKLGAIELRLGHSDAAIELWQRCLGGINEAPQPERAAELSRKLGAAFWQRGNRDAAIANFQAGIALLDGAPPTLGLVRLYADAASLYTHTGESLLAIYAAEQSLGLAKAISDPVAASRAYGIFGRLLGRIGKAEQARLNLEQAVAAARASKTTEVVRSLIALADYLESAEQDLVAAQQAYEDALELALRFGLVPAQVEISAGLARIAIRYGDSERAARWTEQASELARTEGVELMHIYFDQPRAWLLWHAGRDQEAILLLRRVVADSERADRAGIQIPALITLATALMANGEPIVAARRLLEAEQLARRAGSAAQRAEALVDRAIALRLARVADEQVAEAAEQALAAAEQLEGSAAQAYRLESKGLLADDPGAALEWFDAAAAIWAQQGWTLAAARADALAALALIELDPAAAAVRITRAAEEFERLGILAPATELRRRLDRATRAAPATPSEAGAIG